MKDYFVVGDVHGCFYTLKQLLTKWEPQKQQLIFVGDIIDHGNHSPQVAELIYHTQKEHKDTVVLRGNHEHQFIDHCLNGFNQDWYEKSGERTFRQYLIGGREINEDAKWFATFPLVYEAPNLMVSHAGVPYAHDPFNPDNRFGVVWHRDEIKKLEQLQVYGHTPKEDAIFDYVSNAINIDTGAYKSNKLTAVIINCKGEIQDLISINTQNEDLPSKEEEALV